MTKRTFLLFLSLVVVVGATAAAYVGNTYAGAGGYAPSTLSGAGSGLLRTSNAAQETASATPTEELIASPTAEEAEQPAELLVPVLLSPPDDSIGSRLDLAWNLGMNLGEDQWAEVQIWPDQPDAQPGVFGWYMGSAIVVTAAHLMPGQYRWRVAAVQGRDTNRGEELSAYSIEGTFGIVRPSTKASISITPPVVPSRTPTPDANTLAVAPEVALQLVRVPAVKFTIGSSAADPDRDADEKPQRSVYVDEYLVGKTEVTVGAFRAFVDATGYAADPRALDDMDTRPVRYVSWDDAVAFCVWASEVTGRDVHLLTEAQWEQAARGTDARIYPWGNTAPDETLCNFQEDIGDTTDVGLYSPDGDSYHGCADMAGNVWEWVQDLYSAQAYGTAKTNNPSGPSTGSSRVVRGGGWTDESEDVRAAARKGISPDERLDDLGFRVCVSSTTPTPTPTMRRYGWPTMSPTPTVMRTIVQPTLPQPTLPQPTVPNPNLTPTDGGPTPTFTPVPSEPVPTNTPDGYNPPEATQTPGGTGYTGVGPA